MHFELLSFLQEKRAMKFSAHLGLMRWPSTHMQNGMGRNTVDL